MMQQILLFGASLLAGTGVFIHAIAGGRAVAAPLLADQHLSRLTKWLAYCCWHIVTLLMGLMSAGFLLLALNIAHHHLGYFLVILSFAISLLCLGVAIAGKLKPLRFPPVTMFLLMGSIALIGLW